MRLSVLVVEDDSASLELICETLNASGIDARGMRSPVHAAAMIDEEKFDGIFLDLSMPGMDGMELARRIRKSGPNASTPIVVVSGRMDRDVIKQAFEAGAQFYLPKPLDRVKLKRLVSTTQGSLLSEYLQTHPVEMRTPVLCRTKAGDCTGFSSQVSPKGMVFTFEGALRPGELVQLSFRIPDTESVVEAAATVLRIMRSDGPQKAGVRFDTVNASGKRALRQYISITAGRMAS